MLGNGSLVLGNEPLVLGNGSLVLGNGPLVLGNGSLVLGNVPLVSTQFMKRVYLLIGRLGWVIP